ETGVVHRRIGDVDAGTPCDKIGGLEVVEGVLALDVPGAVAHALAAGDGAEDRHGRVLRAAEPATVRLPVVEVVEAAGHVPGAVLAGASGRDNAGGERHHEQHSHRQHEPDLPALQHQTCHATKCSRASPASA